MFNKRMLIIALLLATVALAACSPEATRVRGGGPGADVGNRDQALPQMHGQGIMFHHTPLFGEASKKAGLGK